ncbi:MAG: hypothetical protein ACLF0G_08805 [Candidatus Brocadiia bacterium]
MAVPDHPPATLGRESLECATERLLRPPRGAKPAIRLIRHGGRRLVVKDFRYAPWLLRHTYGRWLVSREARVYARLDGVPGVPAFHGRLDPFAFAVTHIEGQTLKALPRRDIPAAAFDRLEEVIRRIHDAGVVHLDAHQKTNVLLDPRGQPYLVDFATALCLGTGPVGRLLVRLLGRADRLGVFKLKARYCPDALREGEAKRLRRGRRLGWLWPPSALRRLIRWVKRGPAARTQGREGQRAQRRTSSET